MYDDLLRHVFYNTGSSKLVGKKNKRRKDVDPDQECDDVNGRKKMRTTFTGKQIFELEKSFESKKYLSSSERAEMANNLQVTQQQVFLRNTLVHSLIISISGEDLVPKPKNQVEED